MGLLSFLNGNKQRQGPVSPELKAQSYDTTAIALPPIRGGLPVQGNGPNTLSDLKRAARKRSEAQLSTRTEPSYNNPNYEASAPAPAPVVARLRSKSLGRPSTAPSVPKTPLPGTSRPKSAGRNTPSFINTKRPPGPPYLVGVHGQDDEQDALGDAPPPVPPIAARFMSSLPSSPIISSRPKGPASTNGSVLSGRSDGQSSKGGRTGYVDLLDASGAFKPSDFKTRLQATGARDYGEDVAERNMGVNGVDLNSPAVLAFYALTGGGPLAYRSDGSAVDVHGNRYAADSIPTNLATQVQGKDKDELLKLANQKMRTAQFPTRTTSLQPQPIVSPADDSVVDQTNSSAPSRRLSLHGAPTSNSSKQAKQRPLSMHPAVSTGIHMTSSAPPPDVPRSRPATSSGNKKSLTQRQSRSDSKSTSKERSSGNLDQDERARRARSSSSASRKGRKTQRPGDYSHFNSGIPETDKSLPPLPTSRPSTSSGNDSRSQGRTGQPQSSSQPRSHPRKRSTGATSLRSRGPQLHDIDENRMPVPVRDNESVSSKAPSTVASSNNQSRHTADTSLDLGFSMPKLHQGKLTHVRGKSSGANSGRLTSTFSSQRAQAPKPADGDDYLTTTTDGSDVESYPDKRKKRQQDGEHLLFNEDRYGSMGGGLPGLFDPHGSMGPTTSASTKPGRITDYRPPTSAPRVKPPSLVSWQDNSSASSLTVSESGRTGLSGDYDPEEQEMDEKLDVKLAVRLRKEMKKRERLSTRRPADQSKAYEIYEQGHVADSEI